MTSETDLMSSGPCAALLACRSITLLPAALSPHSLASLPTNMSYTDSLASGSALPQSFSYTDLGQSPEEQGAGEESEYSESDVGEMSGHGGTRALERLQRRGSNT